MDNHDGVVIHLELDILECEVKWALGSITTNKASGDEEIQLSYLKPTKMTLLQCCSQYVSKFGKLSNGQFNSVQLFTRVQLFAASWITACQTSLSITNFWSPPKPMSIESVMPPNHLILCRPLLLLSSIFASITVFSNESALGIRWPKCWEFQLQHRFFQ